VKAFQIQNDLTPVDGVAGNVTITRLYSEDALAASDADIDYDKSEEGDSGALVKEIQECLVQMGYLDEDDVTGIYDETTVEAVKKFQKKNGLTADGVAGDQTLMLLFGY